MKKQRSKRFILMMISIILVISSFLSSCTSSTGKDSSSTDASSAKDSSSTLDLDSEDTGISSKYAMSDVENMTAPGVLPIVIKPVTLTIELAAATSCYRL